MARRDHPARSHRERARHAARERQRIERAAAYERSLGSDNRARRRARTEHRAADRVPPGTGGCTKVGYVDADAAARALTKIAMQGGDRRRPVRSYRCPNCQAWHLTSKAVRGGQRNT